jgi:hypothetical protein
VDGKRQSSGDPALSATDESTHCLVKQGWRAGRW